MNADERKARHRVACRKYYGKNRERVRAQQRNAYATNPEVRASRGRYQTEWQARNRGKVNARRRAWYAKNKAACREYDRSRAWRKRGLLEPPSRPRPELCDVCGAAPKKKALSLDHNHATGVFRGWLCDACNLTLGKVGESPAILRALANYLEQEKRA